MYENIILLIVDIDYFMMVTKVVAFPHLFIFPLHHLKGAGFF